MKHINIRARTPEGAVLRLLDVLTPADIGTAVDLLIARLDAIAPDPDLEDSDEDCCSAHDDDLDVPGVQLGGPHDHAQDDDCRESTSWTEWHTRGRYKVGRHGEEQCRRSGIPNMCHEDDEDDDPIEANGDEHDTGDAEDEALSPIAKLAAQYWHDGPGCYLADIPEPSMGAPEACAGGWQAGKMGSNTDQEPWVVPASLNPPMAANDQVPA